MWKYCLASLSSLLLWSAAALAQGDAGVRGGELTQRGRIMASGGLGGVWSNDGTSPYGSYATWTLHADPALTYFVRDALGVGVVVNGAWSKGELYPTGRFKQRELGAALELVRSFGLGAHWSLMLRPRVGYARVWTDMSDAALLFDGETHYFRALSYARFALSLPFVYAVNENIGVGIGPDLRVDVLFGHENQRNGQDLER